MTRIEIEDKLGKGLLWARMSNGNLWRLRRNGVTKLWKTRPNEYSIPVKAGLKLCGRITDLSDLVLQNDGSIILESI